MAVPAVDYEGSGAVHYLRAEIEERREIRLLLPEWPASEVLHTYQFVLPKDVAITALYVESNFEARRNLQAVIATVSARSPLNTDDLAAADAALERIRDRLSRGEENWTVSLAAYLSLHRD